MYTHTQFVSEVKIGSIITFVLLNVSSYVFPCLFYFTHIICRIYIGTKNISLWSFCFFFFTKHVGGFLCTVRKTNKHLRKNNWINRKKTATHVNDILFFYAAESSQSNVRGEFPFSSVVFFFLIKKHSLKSFKVVLGVFPTFRIITYCSRLQHR